LASAGSRHLKAPIFYKAVFAFYSLQNVAEFTNIPIREYKALACGKYGKQFFYHGAAS